MRITVTLGPGVERYAAALSAVPARAMRAFAEGLNEGGDKFRTIDRRALKGQTGVKRYGTIVSHTGTRRASAGNLEYTVLGLGKGLPIKEFPVSAAAHGPVTAQPWNVGHTFERSFKTSRKGLLRARRGSSRFPIRALYGPSIAKEIVKDESAAAFHGQAAPLVEAAVFKRLGRLLP
ncbi:hypothetical protein [Methylobacterium gnaphalii]|uniref:Uncharacterized protein n=1 Tax=Methylobacterium gnaphalii TaxID=1010610 RepID=A0A512JPC6_9HYPH|nr:hypothetical protein [Methylobacterium gnaphalii]GEP11807.1 hypothetical protein MGN01_36520 [Methylobacterium gnaphalii]GJD69484.1 hypothetical protein MMMDOFMJ_2415 [Methylobacterium gnaphalii]GLS49558.1 hypothetical protein GCM10007885_24070 [Methylobacterium gnaphalii]